jgi:hypothetical protein
MGTVAVDIVVGDKGSINRLNKEVTGLRSNLESTKRTAADTAAVRMSPKYTAAQSKIPDEPGVRGLTRGATGVGGGVDAKDFARQAQGLGGLVHIYATFAANIFAVGAAFTALKNAMDFEVMIEGAKQLEARTGAPIRALTQSMKDLTDGALSAKDAMRLAALATAAGLTQKQIEGLTKGAKTASIVLGRDMADSIDRVIRGVAKREPELLDELGITLKFGEAYKAYAQRIGVAEDSLSGYQKTLAGAIAVQEEFNRKFGASAEGKANPYSVLLGTIKDAVTEIANVLNKVLAPLAGSLADNFGLVVASILLVVKSLVSRAIPEIGKMFVIDKDLVESNVAAVKKSQEQIAALRAREMAAAYADKEAKIALLTKQLDQEKILQERAAKNSLDIVKHTSISSFSNKSKTAQQVKGATSLDELRDDQYIRSSFKAKETVVAKALAEQELVILQREHDIMKAMSSTNTAATASLKEQLAIDRARHTELTLTKADLATSNKLLRTQAETSKEILLKEQEIAAVRARVVEPTTSKISKTFERQANSLGIAEAKSTGRSEMQTARFQFGSNSPEFKKAEEAATSNLTAALTKQALTYKYLTTTQTAATGSSTVHTTAINVLGLAYVKAGVAAFAFGVKIAQAAQFLISALGWISMIGTAIYVLYEGFKYAATALGLFSEAADRANKVGDDTKNIIEANSASMGEYNRLLNNNRRSIDEELALLTSRYNAYSNSAEAIQKEIDVVKEWQKEKGALDRNKEIAASERMIVLLDQTIAKSDEATAAVLRSHKLKIEANKAEAISLGLVTAAQKAMAQAADAAGEAKSKLESLTGAYKQAAEAADNLSKKEIVKDSNLKAMYDYLGKVKEYIATADTTTAAGKNALANQIGRIAELTPLKNTTPELYATALAVKAYSDNLKTIDAQIRETERNRQIAALSGHKDSIIQIRLHNEELKVLQKKRGELVASIDTTKLLSQIDVGLAALLKADAAKDVGTSGRDRAYQQARDLRQAEIDLQKTYIDSLTSAAALEEKIAGYSSDALAEKIHAENEILLLQNANNQSEEANRRRIDARAGIQDSVYQKTLHNIGQQLLLEKEKNDLQLVYNKQLNIQKKLQEDTKASNIELRNLNSKKSVLEESVTLENRIVEIRKESGSITASQAIQDKAVLDRLKQQLEAASALRALKAPQASELRPYQERVELAQMALANNPKDKAAEGRLLNAKNELAILEATQQTEIDGLNRINKLKLANIEIEASYQRSLLVTEEALLRVERASNIWNSDYFNGLLDDFNNKLGKLVATAKSAGSSFNEGMISAVDDSIDKFFTLMQTSELTFRGMMDSIRNSVSDVFRDYSAQLVKNMWKSVVKEFLGESSDEKAARLAEEARTKLTTELINSQGSLKLAINDLTKAMGGTVTADISEPAEELKKTSKIDSATAKVNKDTASSYGGIFSKMGSDLSRFLSGNMGIMQYFSTLIESLGSMLVSFISNLSLSSAANTGSSGGILGSLVNGIVGIVTGGIASAGSSAPFSGGPVSWESALAPNTGVMDSISKYTNTVISSPTTFPFAKGGVINTGLMGEAGPEAIIPLKRGANGSLGISGGSGISNNVEINITIDSAGNAQSSSSDTASMAGQLGGLIKQAVSQELIRQTRPGGLLAR